MGVGGVGQDTELVGGVREEADRAAAMRTVLAGLRTVARGV